MGQPADGVVAVMASDAPPRTKPSNYPLPFAALMHGRVKRPLGDLFGLQSFGINHVTLEPGAVSALFHRHAVQDEFIYVLVGEITLLHDAGATVLTAGMCAGFPHNGTAHQLINRSGELASYLEMGDRQTGDSVSYPRDDLVAQHRQRLGIHLQGRRAILSFKPRCETRLRWPAPPAGPPPLHHRRNGRRPMTGSSPARTDPSP